MKFIAFWDHVVWYMFAGTYYLCLQDRIVLRFLTNGNGLIRLHGVTLYGTLIFSYPQQNLKPSGYTLCYINISVIVNNLIAIFLYGYSVSNSELYSCDGRN
jgi:hypothetical protein